MLNDVDDSLRALIRRDVVNGSSVEVALDAPTREWSARRSVPTLNLYLYDISEDLDQRQHLFEEVRDGDGRMVDRRKPPRIYRLAYLVTAWTQRPEDEHRLLAGVLDCFLRFDALPQDVLQGALADLRRALPVSIGRPLPAERSLSDIWTALGGELKPSLDLVVRVPFPIDQHFAVGPIVTEEPRLRFQGPDGKTETPTRQPAAPAPESFAPAAAEAVQGGRTSQGRTFTWKTLPRS